MNAKFIALDTPEKLEELFKKSSTEPVVLFKHSTTCPISFGVYDEIANAQTEINIVIVQQSRSISNEIASRTGIRHESPQAIVLKNRVAVYHASHYDITSTDVENSLNI